MKIAKVIPLFKSGDRCTTSNYRPISLFPTLSKIFEKIIYEMLSAHLEQNDFLFDYQFGFRKKRSTTLAILDFVKRITNSIDDGGTSIGVFLDLSKAFDTVNHDVLLDKLSYYGINNETKYWFSSYLKNRKQYVCVDGVNSNVLPLECGVPQGSVLGPILILIYINDAQFITNFIHLVLYADDMNLLVSNKSLKKSIMVLNKELARLEEWFQANKLTVNLSKTKFILFGFRQRLTNSTTTRLEQDLNLKLGRQIDRVTHTKFLGLVLDENLSWSFHIDSISRKIAKSIGILYRAQHYLKLDSLKNLYYSFIFSHISYGTLIWGSNYKLLPIHLLQKRALLAIIFTDLRTPSRPLFQRLDILNIFEIVKLQLSELAYNHNTNQLPEVFYYYFRDISTIHSY